MRFDHKMDSIGRHCLSISDSSQVGDAKRRSVAFATEHGLESKDSDRVALVVSEMCTNLLKHTAGGGMLLMQPCADRKMRGIDIYCIDQGEGMADLKACLADGYSTKQTMGTGLGAMKRVANEFEIGSAETGTIVFTRFYATESREQSVSENLAAICIPKPGEEVCGDIWRFCGNNKKMALCVLDGLGHGFEAAEAAKLGAECFDRNWDRRPDDCLRLIHSALSGSRGAVGAIALIDIEKQTLSYCGLGNITGVTLSNSGSKHLVSLNGTLGYDKRKFQQYDRSWEHDCILVMHSDGLSSNSNFDLFERQRRQCGVITGSLFSSSYKGNDDITVVAMRVAP